MQRLTGLKNCLVFSGPIETPRKATAELPFSLCFGIKALILTEIGSPITRNDHFNPEQNELLLQENLPLVKGLCNDAVWKDEQLKRAAARYHNSWVRLLGIKGGDLVLRKNEVSRQEPSRKLDTFWEGPYKVIKTHGNSAYVLQDTERR